MSVTEDLPAHVIEKIRTGDLCAFDALYHQHKRTVYALCLRGTKDAADAEDLTQEVFLQVYRKVKDFRGESAFKSWLYRVTINTILMHVRKRRLDAIPLHYFLNSATAPVVNALQTRISRHFGAIGRIALSRAIAGLPKGWQAIVVLHDVKGMSSREIASSLGVSLNTTKSNLWRAHRQLRGVLSGTSAVGVRKRARLVRVTRSSIPVREVWRPTASVQAIDLPPESVHV